MSYSTHIQQTLVYKANAAGHAVILCEQKNTVHRIKYVPGPYTTEIARAGRQLAVMNTANVTAWYRLYKCPMTALLPEVCICSLLLNCDKR